MLVKLDKLLDENSETISGTLKNAENFTKTLADNSAQISTFIKDATDVAHSLKPAAARLDKVLATGEQTIKAIDPKKLKTITGNIAGASTNLKNFSATGCANTSSSPSTPARRWTRSSRRSGRSSATLRSSSGDRRRPRRNIEADDRRGGLADRARDKNRFLLLRVPA